MNSGSSIGMKDMGIAEQAVTAETPVLPPRYYLDNFRRLRDAVLQRYGDLLESREQAVLATLDELPEAAQCLYLRLVSRVGPWFRASRLVYQEIGDTGPALDDLLQAGLIEEMTALDVDTLGRLFTRAEIAALYGAGAGPGRAATKGLLLDAVAGLDADDEARWQRVCERAPDRVVTPLALDTVELLELLFFGNRRQGLVDFVLSDLGIARYYPYALDRRTRLFADRAAVEAYRAVGAVSDRHWQWREAPEAAGLGELADAALALDVRDPVARRSWWRLCNRLARDCERLAMPRRALALYESSERHPARERRARVLEGLGDDAGALGAVEAMLAEPWCEAEAAAAERMGRRLRRRLQGVPQPRPRDRFATAALSVVPASGSVERDAAAALAERDGVAVYYVENALLPGLFGLAFWEEIFADVPGAFHHGYQSAPADMYSAEFHAVRADAIAARFDALAGVDLERELVAAWRRYRGYQCRWVDWRRLDEALVAHAARCLPYAHLEGVWRRLLFDTADNRRGFPDLIALGEAEGDYHLYEVKGPGDALQEHQRRWLNHFAGLGMPATLLQVSRDGG